jgi:membrane protein
VTRLLQPPLRLVRAWVERVVEMEGVDRAVVLGAQAFAALFPLLIVYSAVLDRGGSTAFVERLIERLDLSGSAADSLRQAFAPEEAVESSVTAFSVLILVVSALTFTRAMQRMYERAWRLEPRGLRSTGWGLVWLAGLAVYGSLRQAIDGALAGPADVIGSIALGTALWLVTPFILLARREAFRALLPGAVLTAASMTTFSVVTVVAAPRSFTTSASAYGLIGVAFAMVGWLIAAAIVVMLAAALGAVIAEMAGLRRPAAKPGASG